MAATTLTGCHFLVTTVMMALLRLCGFIKPTSLPFPELLKFAFAANFSIVGMNVSLMWNTVGFYQVPPPGATLPASLSISHHFSARLLGAGICLLSSQYISKLVASSVLLPSFLLPLHHVS